MNIHIHPNINNVSNSMYISLVTSSVSKPQNKETNNNNNNNQTKQGNKDCTIAG